MVCRYFILPESCKPCLFYLRNLLYLIEHYLNDFRLEVAAGEKIAIVGESGAGKSSLLNIIGLLDRNYSGEYTLFGSPTDQLHTSQLAQWRNQRIGFVLQESALINSLTVEDNIKLPFLYASPDKKGVGEIAVSYTHLTLPTTSRV